MMTAPRSLETWVRPKAAVEQASRLFALSWSLTKQARRLLYGTRGAAASSLFVLVLVSVAGCNRSTGYERYVPASALAEEALGLVLAAWKSGDDSAALRSTSSRVAIQVADSTRRPGQRLVAYQLLGEVSGEGPRSFRVRLKLENPSLEEEVLYYFVGIDPLWVFRQEDYDAVAHWDVCAREEEQASIDRRQP